MSCGTLKGMAASLRTAWQRVGTTWEIVRRSHCGCSHTASAPDAGSPGLWPSSWSGRRWRCPNSDLLRRERHSDTPGFRQGDSLLPCQVPLQGSAGVGITVSMQSSNPIGSPSPQAAPRRMRDSGVVKQSKVPTLPARWWSAEKSANVQTRNAGAGSRWPAAQETPRALRARHCRQKARRQSAPAAPPGPVGQSGRDDFDFPMF